MLLAFSLSAARWRCLGACISFNFHVPWIALTAIRQGRMARIFFFITPQAILAAAHAGFGGQTGFECGRQAAQHRVQVCG